MFERVLKCLPLALSTCSLICLAIVFSGCISPSSPSDLYFMKVHIPRQHFENKTKHSQVNLTSFSTIDFNPLRREISVGSLDSATVTSEITSAGGDIISSAGTVVAQASATAQTAASQVNNSIQGISNSLKSNLPGYYSVGLLGYCEGHDDKATYCSKPNTSFSFSITDLFKKAYPEVSDLIPGIGGKALGGYQLIARWSISANILGVIFSSASIIFGITNLLFSWGRIFHIISHLVCSRFQRSK